MSSEVSGGVFYPLPNGKPNPTELYTGPEGDSRSRVAQKPNKGDTCLYYAFNMIRHRIGKFYEPQFKGDRDIEHEISSWRKNITHLESKRLDDTSRHFLSSLIDYFDKYPPLASLRKGVTFVFDTTSPFNEAEEAEINAYIAEFQSSTDFPTFLDFLKWRRDQIYRAGIEIDNELLAKLRFHIGFRGTPPDHEECLYKLSPAISMPPQFMSDHKSYTDSNVLKNADIFIFTCLAHAIIQSYKLTRSKWTPECPFDILLQELTAKKHMVVSGKIGQRFYTEGPRLMEDDKDLLPCKIHNLSVLYFSKASRHPRPSDYHHSVVIVGAERLSSGREFVYFVDPMDPSDTNRPLYIMSYQSLQQHITPLGGKDLIYYGDSSERIVIPPTYGTHPPESTTTSAKDFFK